MAQCPLPRQMAERQSVMTQDNEGTGENELTIVRGRVDSLSLYEITETELYTLERGSPYSIHLNIGVSLFTLGLSFLTSLLTIETQAQSTILLIVFVVLTIAGIIGGTILIILWKSARVETTDVVKRIKQRIGEQEDVPHTSG